MSTQVMPHGLAHATPAKSSPRARNEAPSLTVAIATAAMALSVVVADRYLSVWTDGHVVAAWLLTWAVVFAVFVATRTPSRLLAARVKNALDVYAARVADRRAERRFEQLAQTDSRIMAELQAARARADEAQAFDQALAPMGWEAPAPQPTQAYQGMLFPTDVYYRGRNVRLYYI